MSKLTHHQTTTKTSKTASNTPIILTHPKHKPQPTQKLRQLPWPIIAPLLAFFLLTTIILIIFLTHQATSATLDLLVAPADTTNTISLCQNSTATDPSNCQPTNSKTYKNGTYKLPPGTYLAHLEKSDFTPQDHLLTLTAGQTTDLHTYLNQADGTFTWYQNHPSDLMILDTIGDTSAEAASRSYREKYPIVADLPLIYAHYDDHYNYTEYRIDGGQYPDCPQSFCLKITDSTGGNYEPALDLIRSKGYNPDDYHILYQYTPVTPLD